MSKQKTFDKGHVTPNDLSSRDIIAALRGDFWKEVICYESLDSTNEAAFSLSLRSRDPRIVVISDSQAKGRGRLGRVWFSPPGRNIYMSVVLVPEIEPRHMIFLTVAATLACADALRKTTGLVSDIKWPNDLMAQGKKIGGILTELRSGRDRTNLAVVGIGLNVNSVSDDFLEELKNIATSIKEETGNHYRRSGIIAAILNELQRRYEMLKNEGRLPLLKEWRRRSSTLQKSVRIVLHNEVVSGVAEDLDDDGMLVLKLRSGVKRRISAGDLTELR